MIYCDDNSILVCKSQTLCRVLLCEQQGRNVLHAAAEKGNDVNILKYLIESCEADVNAKNVSVWLFFPFVIYC